MIVYDEVKNYKFLYENNRDILWFRVEKKNQIN